MRGRLGTAGVMAVAAIIGIAAALVIGPRPLQLGDRSGDEQLAERVREVLGEKGHEQVAVAYVDGGSVRFAGFGATETTPFEIGSVTKALTGMVLAQMAEAGEVRLDEPVGELVPGTPLAGQEATLQELSQHRSGLPRMPFKPELLLRQGVSRISGGDPYEGDPQQVLTLAGEAGAKGGSSPQYSNLGVSALGDALAVRAGSSYADLLAERVLQPLRMTDTRVVAAEDDLPEGRATGRDAGSGIGRDPWIATGWAPAGVGVWSTTRDLAALAQGALAGTAPGATAVDDTWAYTDDKRIGLGWITSEQRGRTITWHNGATGGFHAFVGLDRERNRAIVVLSASTESVDAAAIDLLTDDVLSRGTR